MKANTLYKFIFPDVYVGNSAYYLDLFECGVDDCVLCLGEITNMPDRYIMVSKSGKVIYGVCSDIFIECGPNDI